MAPSKQSSKHPTIYKDALADLSINIEKSTPRPPKVDLDKNCGVDTDGSPCPKPLRDCQTHSRVQKRAVLGRSCSYDMLIIPSWGKPSQGHSLAIGKEEGYDKGVAKSEKKVDNGEGSSKGVKKFEKKAENGGGSSEGVTKFETAVDNGEGSSKGVTKTEKKVEKETKEREKVSPKENAAAATTTTTTRGKRKAVDEDSDEDAPKPPPKSKGKKRGPKAWTALEAEGS
jgi:SCA7, zinc-binding domain